MTDQRVRKDQKAKGPATFFISSSLPPLYCRYMPPPRLRDDKMGPPYGLPFGKALIGTPWSAPQSPGWFLKPVKLTMKTNHGVKTHHYIWQMLG